MIARNVAKPHSISPPSPTVDVAGRASAPARDRLDDKVAGKDALTEGTAKGVAWSFSKMPLLPSDPGDQPPAPPSFEATPKPSVLQPKLAVGRADDPLEQEADRVADSIMRMPAPDAATAPAPSRDGADHAGDVRRLQAKGPPTPESSGVSASVSAPEAFRSNGRPLEASTRAFFELRFGCDFSAVSLHTDDHAASVARSINALAYAAGSAIGFAPGQYQPSTDHGRRLLAHELAHVVQQSAGRPSPATIRRQEQAAAGGGPAPLEDRAVRPASKAIIRALQEVPAGATDQSGVGDFPKVFHILDGLAMFDMLDTLQELDTLGQFQLIKDNIGLAEGVGVSRIQVAIAAVRDRGAVTPDAFAAAQGEAFSKLPPEQQTDVTRFLSKFLSPNPFAEILPEYKQRGDSCGAASLVSALMIWDREHWNPAEPNSRVVSACNISITKFTKFPESAKISKSTWVETLTDIRDKAKQPGGRIEETDYQVIGASLYLLWKQRDSGGMQSDDIFNLKKSLNLTQTNVLPSGIKSMDDLFTNSVVTGLKNDEIAQARWFAKRGREFIQHAFLIGRLKTGEWFLSDQGVGKNFKAPDLNPLKSQVSIAAHSGAYWLFTGTLEDIVAATDSVNPGWGSVDLLASQGGH
jgi:hypothetical protein